MLVVKKDNENIEFKNIVFASSFKKEDKKDVLRKQLEIAFIFDNKIHLLKVTTTLGFESTLEATKKSKDFGT